jgi:hypothetical protein
LYVQKALSYLFSYLILTIDTWGKVLPSFYEMKKGKFGELAKLAQGDLIIKGKVEIESSSSNS